MVAAAREDKPPPLPEQQLFSLCKTFNCLPSELEGEDYALIQTMLLFDSVRRSVSEYSKAEGKEIHTLPEPVKNMIDWLKERGIYEGGMVDGDS